MELKKFIKYQLKKFNNFERLCKSNNIDIYNINRINDLSWDEIIIEYRHDKNSNLLILISNDMREATIPYFRLLDCLEVWIPCIQNCYKQSHRNIKIKINISDEGDMNTYSMDSINKDKLIPDQFSMYDHYKKNYEVKLLAKRDFIEKWMLRTNIIFWRGSTTGKFINDSKDLSELERIKYCLEYQKINGFDIKISKVTQTNLKESVVVKWLKEKKIYAKPVPEDFFSKYRYYPDIPGNSLAWGTIRKYRSGNLVFKSNTVRNLYYYRLMKEWKHYIPLENDLKDIKNKYLWAEQNQYEAAEIAYNGYLVANKYIHNIPAHFACCIGQ